MAGAASDTAAMARVRVAIGFISPPGVVRGADVA
jgi:hypothetical protein